MPTLAVKVRAAAFIYAEKDGRAVYEVIPVTEKYLCRIKGTTQRFRGYKYFSENLALISDWYEKYSA